MVTCACQSLSNAFETSTRRPKAPECAASSDCGITSILPSGHA